MFWFKREIGNVLAKDATTITKVITITTKAITNFMIQTFQIKIMNKSKTDNTKETISKVVLNKV